MYSKEIAERVKEFLISRNYAWSFNDGSGVFRVGFNLHNKLSRCEVIGMVRECDILSITVLPFKASDNTISDIAIYMALINGRRAIGNFEIDSDDMELQFRSFVDCDGGVIPTDEMLDDAFNVPPATIDKFGDGFVDILFNGKTAFEVFGEIMEQSTPTALVEEIDQQVTPSNAGIC